MKIFKEIFGRVFALWAIFVFVITMLLFLIPFFLFCYFKSDPLKTIRFVSFSRVWMDVFYFFIGSSLKANGRENFKQRETYIVACNHHSYFDVTVTSPRIPGGNKTIGKIEISKVPVFNLIYNVGTVLVDRKSERSRSESFVKMKNVLSMGLHMCIYPEGTRNRTNEALKSFHNGAFKLAIDTGNSIIPAVIFNTGKVLPADKTFYLWPHKITIDFLPAVKIESTDSIESLKKKVFDIMKAHYENGTRDK